MRPLISVIIPVYNAEKYIQTAVECTCAQSYENLEILFVNDGSTDRTDELVKSAAEADKRIRIVHQTHSGLACGRNRGLCEATGEMISFIDVDDYICPEYIEKLYDALKTYDVPLACCNHTIVKGQETKLRFPAEENKTLVLTEKQAFENILYHGIPDVSAWGKLARKEIYQEIVYPAGKLYEDTYQIAEMIHAAQKLIFISDALYEYRIHKNSISHNAFSDAQMDFIDAVDHMTEVIAELYPNGMKAGILRRKMHALLSVRRLLVDTKSIPQKTELDNRIKMLAREVLPNKALPFRDRIGIHAVQLGDWCFDTLWKYADRSK